MPNKRPRKLPVTDHAVLRWLERNAHVDVESVREDIYRDCEVALKSGATRIVTNGTDYRMRDGHVITLFPRRKKLPPLKWKQK